MSFISNRFPILRNPLTGWLIIMLGLSVLLIIAPFQETVELPKVIAWFISLGIALIIFVYQTPNWSIKLPKSVSIGLLLLVILWLVGIPFSADITNTIFGVFPRFTGSILFFSSWIIAILLFSLVSSQKLLILLKYYALLSVPVALFGIIQSFGVAYYAGLNAPIRILAPSFLGNPNFSAMFVVTALPIMLWMMFSARSKILWYSYLLCVSLLFLSLVIFNSRGAFVGIAISILIYTVGLMLNRSWKQLAVVIVIGTIFISTFGIFFYQTRVNVLNQQAAITDDTISSRLLLWDVTTQYIKEHPWFGTGFGNFFILFRSNTHPALANQEWFDDAHNFVIHVAATNGIPVTLVFLFLFGYAIYSSVKRYRQESEPGLDFSILASLLGWLVVGSFTPVSISNLVLLALLLAFAWQGRGDSVKYTPTYPVKVLVVILSLGITLLGIAMLSGEVFLWQSKLAIDRGDSGLGTKLGVISYRSYPYNTSAYINFINNEIKDGQYDLADRDINAFLAQHPVSSGLYQTATNFYSQIYELNRDKKFETKMYAANAAMVAYNSNYANPYKVAALQLVYNHDYEAALPYVEKSIVLDGKDYNSWILIAKIHYEMKNYNATYLAFEQAFRISPDPKLKPVIKKFKNNTPLDQITFPYQF